jgi:hypothetical protein
MIVIAVPDRIAEKLFFTVIAAKEAVIMLVTIRPHIICQAIPIIIAVQNPQQYVVLVALVIHLSMVGITFLIAAVKAITIGPITDNVAPM